MGNVLEMDLTPKRVLEIIRSIASEHSERIFYTHHAKARMRQRKITRVQVLRCRRHGQITEGPAPSMRGSWEFRIETFSAGNGVTVVAALDRDDKGNLIVVITTF